MSLDRYLGSFITASPTAPTQTSAQGVWELEQQASAQVQNAWPLPPNVIQRSLRFNSADSANLTFTPTTAGNTTTFIYSAWVKRTALGATQYLFFGGNNSTFGFDLVSSNTLGGNLRGTGATNYFFETTAVFRDLSAWYHIVFAVDTTQGSDPKFKIYVNGVQQAISATYPGNVPQNTPQLSTAQRIIGSSSGTYYFNGYMSEVNFVGGYPTGVDQTSWPSTNLAGLFGETDPQTGVWVPKVYTGSYGTNGFRLRFNNNTSTTALGYDSSGNGNNWTPNNFSVTAGSGNDSMLDVPSLYGTDTGLGGEVRGNYCTLNPLMQETAIATISDGALQGASGTTGNSTAYTGTIGFNSGKWYYEVLVSAVGTGNMWIGVSKTQAYKTRDAYTNSWTYNKNGQKTDNSPTGSAYGATYTTGDLIGVAIDADAGSITFYKNGVSQGVAFSSLSMSGGVYTVGGSDNSATMVFNFGQRPFAYTAPSGFKALCTTNLSASGTVTTSGTFTGNASTDGPFVYLNGIPTAMTINGNAVTFGTQADKLSNGFKVRSSSASYNTSGSNTYSVSTTGAIFRYSNAQGNP